MTVVLIRTHRDAECVCVCFRVSAKCAVTHPALLRGMRNRIEITFRTTTNTNSWVLLLLLRVSGGGGAITKQAQSVTLSRSFESRVRVVALALA